jgi:hypothetical protein
MLSLAATILLLLLYHLTAVSVKLGPGWPETSEELLVQLDELAQGAVQLLRCSAEMLLIAR